MSGLRRSSRARVKRSILDYTDIDNSSQQKESKYNTSSKRSSAQDSDAEEECKGCKLEISPLTPVDTRKQWIECSKCCSWWHINCAGISIEDSLKLDKYNLKYTCAFCVLSGLNSVSKNISSPVVDNFSSHKVEKKIDQLISVASILTEEISKSKSQNSATKPDKLDLTSTTHCSRDSIIVVDNIPEPKEFQNSQQLKKELHKHNISKEIDLAYSLANGGISLHTKDQESAEKLLENWPEEAFGGSTKPHLPRNSEDTINAYIRSIPVSVSNKVVEKSLSDSNFSTLKVHRLLYSDTHRPMPIIRVTFKDHISYLNAINSSGITIPGVKKSVRFCPERKYRITRCYNCNKFGHISRTCKCNFSCSNCGSEDCQESICRKPPTCSNCGQGHKASSSQCPIFIELQNRRRLLSVFRH